MTENELPPESAGRQDVADQNIERLLSKAYRPEAPDAEFARTVEAAMQSAAARRADRGMTRDGRTRGGRVLHVPLRWVALLTAAAAAVMVASAAVTWHFLSPQPPRTGEPVRPPLSPVVAPVYHESPKPAPAGGMTPRPRPAAGPVQIASAGSDIQTGAAERRRVVLDDGSVLYVNSKSHLRVDGQRQVSVLSGEVFVEVAPSAESTGAPTFLVRTPSRQISALGTKFAVRVGADATDVLVTQGKVAVSGYGELVHAGRQLTCGRDGQRATDLPRASTVLDWTKELMAAAQSPLVPDSEYAGGALIALDPDGQQVKLSLRKYHVDVHVEDGFARTTIDQTYFNHENRRLEGTFYFPLPPDASLSRLAMYVDGKLMEGGMAERDYARGVYESIVYRMKDPALLEWVDGSTFKMRVFPLEARQEKRIVLSYTQKLESPYGQTEYRFPAGHSLQLVRDWSFHARMKGAAASPWTCDSHAFRATQGERDLLLDGQEHNVKIDRDVALRFQDSASAKGAETARFSSASHEGARYLMLRYRPDLPSAAQRQKRDWVFLFESSGDRDPLLARVQVDVIRTILENAEHEDRFSILVAGTHVRTYSDNPLAATQENVKAGVEFLEQSHLVGALDLEQALAAAAALTEKGENAHLVHVGAGVPILGQRAEDKLLQQVPGSARYVGIGVGKRWARSFMKAAAAKTGGYFTQINPDENVAWRAFEVLSTLNTPRLLNVKVAGAAPGPVSFLGFRDAAAAGEEVCAIARIEAGSPLPTAVTVTGMLDGKPFCRTVHVEQASGKADYLPRMWAKLEIDRLLAEGGDRNRQRIVELSKAMYVMSPFTSLLVLENEQMYQQYNVDRGRKDHWAMYPCPDRIPVVTEPLPAQPPSAPAAVPQQSDPNQKPTAQEVLGTILVHVAPQFLYWPDRGYSGGGAQAWTAWQVYTGAYAVPYGYDGGWDWDGDGVLDVGGVATYRGLGKGGGSVNYKYLDDVQVDFLLTAWDANGLVTRVPNFAGPRITLFNVQAVHVLTGAGMNRVYYGGNLYRNGTIISGSRSRIDSRPEVVDLSSISLDANATGVLLLRDANASLGFGNAGRGSGSLNYDGWSAQLTARPGWFTSRDGGVTMVPLSGTVSGPTDPWTGAPVPAPRSTWVNTGALVPAPPSEVAITNGITLSGAVSGTPDPFTTAVGSGPAPVVVNTGVFAPNFTGGALSSNWGNMTVAPAGNTGAIRGGGRMSLETGLRTGGADAGQRAKVLGGSIDRWGSWADFSGASGRRYGLVTDIPSLRLPGVHEPRDPRLFRLGDRLEEGLVNFEDGYYDEDYEIVRGTQRNVMYQRPQFTGNWYVFSDLLAYAPGMNTGDADVYAVLEDEARDVARPSQGRIDPSARKLIDAARAAGWREATLPTRDDTPALKIAFDGAGRFRCERQLIAGLREQVLCDGNTLWHLYPDLGVGAKRSVSRFHRAEVHALLPWIVPAAEDLTRGADVTCLDKRTVAITPVADPGRTPPSGQARRTQSAPSTQPAWSLHVHLVFADDGRLAERRAILRTEGKPDKTLYRAIFADDATVTVRDADDKVVRTWTPTCRPAAAPDMAVDKALVVVPMPIRTRDHAFAQGNRPGKVRFTAWSEDEALAIIIADTYQNHPEAIQVVGQRFFARGDRRIGLYTLLASGTGTWNPSGMIQVAGPEMSFRFDPVEDFPGSPLGRYIAQQVEMVHAGQRRELTGVADRRTSFIGRLAEFHDLFWRWNSGQATQGGEDQRKAERDRALKYVLQPGTSLFGWAILSTVQNHGYGNDSAFHRTVAEAWRGLKDCGGLGYWARYESARALINAGDSTAAGQCFSALYRETLDLGVLPPIDYDFYRALLDASNGGPTKWASLMRETAETLLKKGARVPAVRLAWQVHNVGDQALGAEILGQALAGASETERFHVTMAGVQFLWQTGQYVRADALLQPLLDDKAYSGDPYLWRLGAVLARQRGRLAQSVRCLERALEIEYAGLSGVVNLQAVRNDYSQLLQSYQQVAQAVATLEAQPPKDLAARIVRAADRWRMLDSDGAAACQSAATALQALGAADLAWEYLTTPLAMKPNEAAPWVSMAQTLQQQGELDLAQRAYASAFQAEPTNAQILWDWAQAVQQAGKREEARRLYRQLAEGKWQPRFSGIQSQAQRYLGGQ